MECNYNSVIIILSINTQTYKQAKTNDIELSCITSNVMSITTVSDEQCLL